MRFWGVLHGRCGFLGGGFGGFCMEGAVFLGGGFGKILQVGWFGGEEEAVLVWFWGVGERLVWGCFFWVGEVGFEREEIGDEDFVAC